MAQLYAICRNHNGIIVKLVQTNIDVSNQLENILFAQEAEFLNGINSVIPFTGDWRPDPDELLLVQGLPEAQIIVRDASANAVALPVIDPGDLRGENIVGLCALIGNQNNRHLVIHNFSPQQILSNSFSIFHDGNVFRRITEPALTLPNRISATLDLNGDLKFKSFAMLRRIFDLTPVFQAATNQDLQNFAGHASIDISDQTAFMRNADEITRKYVMAVIQSNVLDNVPALDIQRIAAQIGFNITLNGNRVCIPDNKREAKAVLSFLLNKVYSGPINQQLFITNSNRPLS